jgi:hypothetical protein
MRMGGGRPAGVAGRRTTEYIAKEATGGLDAPAHRASTRAQTIAEPLFPSIEAAGART